MILLDFSNSHQKEKNRTHSNSFFAGIYISVTPISLSLIHRNLHRLHPYTITHTDSMVLPDSLHVKAYLRSPGYSFTRGCSWLHLGVVFALPTRSCFLDSGWISRRGEHRWLEIEKKTKKRLDRNIDVFQKFVSRKHVVDIKARRDVTNWNIGWFPSGPEGVY